MKLQRKIYSKVPLSGIATIALPAAGAVIGGAIGGVKGSKQTKNKLLKDKQDSMVHSIAYKSYIDKNSDPNNEIVRGQADHNLYQARKEYLEAQSLDPKEYRRKNIVKGIRKGVSEGSGYGFLAALPFGYKILKR